ncbi:MAG TPA: Fic family protein [Candidatus Aquilonibacter sp.]|nr:Fic family protein [Candidatus Aquilonibacter sp.]
MSLAEKLPIDTQTLIELWEYSLKESEAKGREAVINAANLEFIAANIQRMIDKRTDKIRIISYALWSVITMHPFTDGNHRTAVTLFYYLGKILEVPKIEAILDDDKIPEYVRTVDNKTLEQVHAELKKMLS